MDKSILCATIVGMKLTELETFIVRTLTIIEKLLPKDEEGAKIFYDLSVGLGLDTKKHPADAVRELADKLSPPHRSDHNQIGMN